MRKILFCYTSVVKYEKIVIKAKVWIYEGSAPWHFITIEKNDAAEIKKQYMWPRRGFGSIPVTVSLGNTTWKTSVFSEKDGRFILPLKKDIRILEHIQAGDTITVSLEVISL